MGGSFLTLYKTMNIILQRNYPKNKHLNPLKRMLRPTLLSLITVLIALSGIDAQDEHFTQFYNTPLLMNPGLAGVFGGNTRFQASYRNQWSSVPVDYNTFAAAVDHKFIGPRVRTGFFTGGLSFNYDRAGTSRLTALALNLHGSYTQKLTRHFYTTLGATVGGNQRRFDISDLMFDNQYDQGAGVVDPSLGSGENFLDNDQNNFFDFSAGINFHLQSLTDASLIDRLEKRSALNFGIGLFHLTRPNQSFIEGIDSPLSMRFSPYVAGVLQLGKDFDLVGSVTAQIQVPYNEYVTGLGGRLHLKRSVKTQLAIQLAFLVRFHEIADTYSPAFELHYNNWHFSFSYDVTLSEFSVATNRRSGPEFSIRYIIKQVKPLPTFKICPLI